MQTSLESKSCALYACHPPLPSLCRSIAAHKQSNLFTEKTKKKTWLVISPAILVDCGQHYADAVSFIFCSLQDVCSHTEKIYTINRLFPSGLLSSEEKKSLKMLTQKKLKDQSNH